MPRKKAKIILKINSFIYTVLVKTHLWRLHRRFLFPYILQYNNIPNYGHNYYYANAMDYYMPLYRHLTSEEEVLFWCKRLGAQYSRSPKGYLITK